MLQICPAGQLSDFDGRRYFNAAQNVTLFVDFPPRMKVIKDSKMGLVYFPTAWGSSPRATPVYCCHINLRHHRQAHPRKWKDGTELENEGTHQKACHRCRAETTVLNCPIFLSSMSAILPVSALHHFLTRYYTIKHRAINHISYIYTCLPLSVVTSSALSTYTVHLSVQSHEFNTLPGSFKSLPCH